jgi:hypothetical protein
MRPVIFVALLGTTLSTNPATAQSSSGQATSGTAESKPQPKRKNTGTSLTDALTENAPERPNALAESRGTAHRESKEDAAGESSAATQAASAPAPAPLPTVQAVPPGPPQKNLTGEEFGLIHVGSTQKEVLAVLGPPSSKVVVPDDDGHLRETLQYWVKGKPLGTVRLDNGRVIQIETKPK